MASKIAEAPRLDPRIKAIFGAAEFGVGSGDVASRAELLAQETRPEAIASRSAANSRCRPAHCR